MKVILQKDVNNLGDAGDIREVADGFARNYLFPKKLAVRADQGRTKAALHHKRLVELKKDKRKKQMEGLSGDLNGKTFTIQVRTGEDDKLFGSVTPIDIAAVLKESGIELDKRKIELAEPIKALGSYNIKIKLAEGVQPSITLNVEKTAE